MNLQWLILYITGFKSIKYSHITFTYITLAVVTKSFLIHFALNVKRSTSLCTYCSLTIYKYAHAIFIQLISCDLPYINSQQVDIHPKLIQLEKGVSGCGLMCSLPIIMNSIENGRLTSNGYCGTVTLFKMTVNLKNIEYRWYSLNKSEALQTKKSNCNNYCDIVL